MDKVIVHIDLNAFFVQCETLENPKLIGKPVAIGREGKRGVISTSSYEARRKGVFSAMPVSTALKKCPDLILVPGDYEKYKRYSNKFFSYLRARFPILQQASIDECYIDMTNEIKDQNLNDYLFDLSIDLYKATKLKCSIGAGWNLFLAKMASDYKKPMGLTILTRENFQKILFPLPIENMFGVGKKSAPKLRELGIVTIGDFYNKTFPEEKKILGSFYQTLKDELDGIGDDFVDTSSFDPKSISSERTFTNDEMNEEELLEMIYQCSVECVNELKKYNKVCYAVGLKLRTPDFVTKSKRLSLNKPTDSLDEIYSLATQIFDNVYNGQSFRLIGVMLERVESKKIESKTKNTELLKQLNDSLDFRSKLTYLGDIKK